MNDGRIVFSQIMDYFPRRRFKSCVERYRGDHRIKTFTCLDQFYCMTFAQLTGRESLRDIEACLRAAGPKLYHAGIKARVTHNIGQSQRTTRLANLSGYRSDSDRPGTPSLCQSTTGYESQTSGLRTGFHRGRSVSDSVSMGTASPAQKCRQGAYATGSARQYSGVYPHYRRSDARCAFSRPCPVRGRSLLYHGQGLHRFSASVPYSSTAGILRDTGQKQHGLHPSSILSGGQKPRFTKRSSHSFDRPQKLGALSRTTAANPLRRCRTEQAVSVSDQQFQTVTVDHCPAVQVSLADRTVLQMDQTAPSYQSLLRDHTQRRQDTGVDRYQRLCAGRYPEKGTRPGRQHVRDSAGCGRHAFRENTRQKPVSGGFQQLFKERYT